MFDTKKLLNDLLNDAKGLATKGSDFAASKLDTKPGADKDNLAKGLGAGALGGVLMGLLLGTKGGRSIGGGALKLGSLAAIGTVAYRAYQQWQQSKTGTDAPVAELAAPTEPRAEPLLLLRAMIAAANADGHIDADERARITADISRLNLGADAAAALEAEIRTPLSAEQLAHGINDPAVATEVYTLSVGIIDDASSAEAAHLRALAAALKLDDGLVAEIKSALAS